MPRRVSGGKVGRGPRQRLCGGGKCVEGREVGEGPGQLTEDLSDTEKLKLLHAELKKRMASSESCGRWGGEQQGVP